MDDRFNTIAGWTLFAGIVALGLSSVSAKFFEADKNHPPHEAGYPVEGVAEDGAGEQAVPLATLLAAADPAKGQAVFAKCTSCHSIAAGGANGIGPNLHGVVGEAIAQGRGGFAFSDALKAVGGNWTFDKLDAWLTSPRAFAAGTKMSFAGLSNPEDRAAVIVYLNTEGSNLPLPAAPAPDAAPAEGDAAADGVPAPADGTAAGPANAPGQAAAGAVAAQAPAAAAGGKSTNPVGE